MILNPNKYKVLVFSRFKTMRNPHGDFALSGVSIRANPNLDMLGVKFDSKLPFEDHVRSIVARVAQIIGILRLVKRIFVNTSFLFRSYYAFVLLILEYYSLTFSFLSARRLFGGQVLCNRRHVSMFVQG